MVRDTIEYHVVVLARFSKIFARVVDHTVGAGEAHSLHVDGTAYSGHFGTERFGNLNRKRAHAARSTVDQNSPSWPNPPFIPQALQRGEPRYRRRCRLLESNVRRLQNNSRFRNRYILGERSLIMHPCLCASCLRVIHADAEHFVTRFDLGNIAANPFHQAREVHTAPAGMRRCRRPYAKHRAEKVRQTLKRTAIERIDGSRTNLYQNFPAATARFFDFRQPQNVGRSILVVNDGFHGFILSEALQTAVHFPDRMIRKRSCRTLHDWFRLHPEVVRIKDRSYGWLNSLARGTSSM